MLDDIVTERRLATPPKAKAPALQTVGEPLRKRPRGGAPPQEKAPGPPPKGKGKGKKGQGAKGKNDWAAGYGDWSTGWGYQNQWLEEAPAKAKPAAAVKAILP